MIGTSDGEQYEDSFAHTVATMGLGATEKAAGALNEGGSYQGSGVRLAMDTSQLPMSSNIDDRRNNISLKHFRDYQAPTATSPQARIHNNIINAVDSQGVTANHRVESGEYDPKEGTMQYAVPDHGQLDLSHVTIEAENPRREAVFRGLKGAGITATDAEFEPLNPMSPHYQNPGGHAREGIGTWFRGAEGKWRQEIPDINSKVKPAIKDVDLPFGERVKAPILKLDDVLHHPELYKSYPDLKDINVAPVPPTYISQGVKGGVSTDGKTLFLKPGLSDAENKSVLVHEIQHLIQKREGFTQGSNPKDMEPIVAKALANTGIRSDGLEQAAAFKAYQHVGGEVEARNAQTRMNWPPEALDIFPPHLTEDIPRGKQLNPPK